MKIPWMSLPAAVAGLIAGIGLSRSSEEKEKDRRDERVREHAGAKPSTMRPLDSRPGLPDRARPATGGHRLEDLFTLDWRLLNLDETGRRLLKADAPTLKGWLDGLLEKEEEQGRSLPVLNLRNRVIWELYRREGTGLLSWAETSENPEVMAECLKCLGRDDAMAAVANLGRFKSLLQQAKVPEGEVKIELMVLLGDLRGAVVFQGPAVIGEFHRQLGADLKGCHEVHSLPEDFDHAAFLHSLEPDQLADVSGVVKSWAMKDRHAALQFALDLDATEVPGAIRWVPEAFLAVGRLEGEESAARWLSDELADASREERERILGGLFPYQSPSPRTCAAILRGLSREEDSAIFRESMKRWFPEGGP
jgi:hypothetical protein